jgi:hypothetical protein
VLKVTGKGMRPFHKVTLNGKELDTRYVRGELEATIPPQAIETAGLYTVIVVSPRSSNGESFPARLIVRFKE